MKVSSFTTVQFVNLSPGSTIRDALSELLSKRLDLGCVTLDGNLLGIIHKNSIHRALLNDTSLDSPIQPLITHTVVTLQKDLSLYEARDILTKANVSQAVVLDDNHRVYGIMTKLDVAKSIRILEHELETTKRLKKILDSALELAYDGVAVTDPDGRITMTNQGFLELFSFQQQDDILGVPIFKVAPQIPSHFSLELDKKIDGELIQIHHRPCIVAQMPIIEDGQKLGAIFKIIFRQLEAWRDILFHMEKLESEISYYRGELLRKDAHPFAHVITQNKQMEKFKQDAVIAGKSLSNVLITGESGTGKELFAEGIHRVSGRKGTFIKVNCGAIPEELLESEFFGYADGAFTGAKKGGKPGKFELADNGTLFLDEIGDMPPSLQVKLLRVLQEQEFERIGATKTTKVNVRLIVATNKDLAELVKLGKFREDLYYRIHVIHLHIPPLRERLDDIPLLCLHFIGKINSKTNRKIIGVSPEVIKTFQKFPWPGNIRQLENVLERAFHYSPSNWIEPEHLPPEMNFLEETPLKLSSDFSLNRKESIHQTEKELILQALKKCSGNRTKTADLLGISRTTLYQKMKKYQIVEEFAFK